MKNSIKLCVLMASASVAMSATAGEIVVVVNAKNSAAAMTAEQVSNVYLGKDTSFVPVDLPESAATRDEFYKKVVGKDSAQIKATWARLIFAGKVQPPKEVGSAAEAVKQVAANEKGMAYVDKSAVDGSVKAVLTLP